MPSAGYTPIYSEIAGKGKTPARRDVALLPRAEDQSLTIENDKIVLPPKQFPVRVQCINVVYIVYTRVKVVKASETSTVTAATPTISITSTHMVSETITEAVQDATTTSIVSETSTISLTSTHWETSTISSTSKHHPLPSVACCIADISY